MATHPRAHLGPGPQGPKGTIGPRGPQGHEGKTGQTFFGPQGLTGHRGPQGYMGHQGIAGTKIGPIGSQGPRGHDGDIGPQGKKGPIGPQGPPGSMTMLRCRESPPTEDTVFLFRKTLEEPIVLHYEFKSHTHTEKMLFSFRCSAWTPPIPNQETILPKNWNPCRFVIELQATEGGPHVVHIQRIDVVKDKPDLSEQHEVVLPMHVRHHGSVHLRVSLSCESVFLRHIPVYVNKLLCFATHVSD